MQRYWSNSCNVHRVFPLDLSHPNPANTSFFSTAFWVIPPTEVRTLRRLGPASWTGGWVRSDPAGLRASQVRSGWSEG